jgi:hypothetical protein
VEISKKAGLPYSDSPFVNELRGLILMFVMLLRPWQPAHKSALKMNCDETALGDDVNVSSTVPRVFRG